MSKLKVAFVLFSDIALGGGAEVAAINYFKYCPRDRYELVLFETDYMDVKRYSDEELNRYISDVEVFKIPGFEQKFAFLHSSLLGEIIYNFISVPFILFVYKLKYYRKFIKEAKPDILVLFNNNYSSLFSSFKGTVIGTQHCWDLGRQGRIGDLMVKLINHGLRWKRIDGFHLFPKEKDYIPILNRTASFSFTNGADCAFVEKIQPAQREDKVCVFSFIARLEECKGVKLIIEAWRVMKHKSDSILRIAGGGTLSNYVKSVRDENLQFLGTLNEEEKSKFYRSSDVFVYPSSCDTFGLVYLEALVEGLYVITTDKFHKVVNLPFEQQVSFNPRNVESLAKAMDDAVERLKFIRDKREMWSESCQNEFCWEKLVPHLFAKIESAHHRNINS